MATHRFAETDPGFDAPGVHPDDRYVGRAEWCDCDAPSDDKRYFNTEYGPWCDCGVESEHLHCVNCGGITQWG